MQVVYDQFIERTAAARHMTPEKVDEIAQGRVWTGAQAKQLGLVDELGGLYKAVDLAKQRARIPRGRGSRAGGLSAAPQLLRSAGGSTVVAGRDG